MRKAFACTVDLKGKHVAVVDDVMTSGASINELARALRQARARGERLGGGAGFAQITMDF